MYCSLCGSKLNENAKFCWKCGAAIGQKCAKANGLTENNNKKEQKLPIGMVALGIVIRRLLIQLTR